MVRLIEESDEEYANENTKFQFHYGAINSLKRYKISTTETVFQFHYGAINRTDAIIDTVVELHFNSTMVRLIVPTSTCVTPISLFQFHYGAINSGNTFYQRH